MPACGPPSPFLGHSSHPSAPDSMCPKDMLTHLLVSKTSTSFSKDSNDLSFLQGRATNDPSFLPDAKTYTLFGKMQTQSRVMSLQQASSMLR